MSSADEQKKVEKLWAEYEAALQAQQSESERWLSSRVGSKSNVVTLEDEVTAGNIKPSIEWPNAECPSEWRVRNLFSTDEPDRDAKQLSADDQKYWAGTFDQSTQQCARAYLRSQ